MLAVLVLASLAAPRPASWVLVVGLDVVLVWAAVRGAPGGGPALAAGLAMPGLLVVAPLTSHLPGPRRAVVPASVQPAALIALQVGFAVVVARVAASSDTIAGATAIAVAALVVLVVADSPRRRVPVVVKRAIDIVVAGTLLVVTAPLIAAIAVVVRIVDGPPVLFRQARSGRGGRPFELVKFRTMRPARADEAGPQHDAERLTRVGRFLRVDEPRRAADARPRRARRDGARRAAAAAGELPPPVQRQQARRLEVRPGITGWAQVHGRNTTAWDERLALDVWYVDHASLALDARILARTVGMVLRGDGIDHAPGRHDDRVPGARASPRSWLPVRPLRVAHLTTVDMSLALLLGAQLDAVVAAGGEAIGISAPGRFVAEIERRGVRHVPLAASTRGWSPWSDLRAARELWRILRRERPTVLHTHNPKPGLYGRVDRSPRRRADRRQHRPRPVRDARRSAGPSCGRVRAGGVRLALVRRRAGPERRGRRADAAAPPRRRHASCATSATASTSSGSVPRRSAPSERAELRTSWGVDDEAIVVGTVGRLVAEKGYHELFRAVADLGPGIRLVVVGGPDAERPDALDPSVLERATAAGVVLLGHRDDVDRLLGGFDLFVLASATVRASRGRRWKPPRQACRSWPPTSAAAVRSSTTGRPDCSCPVADPAALRTAISALAASPERRRAMGAAARAKAEREFDERDVVRQVMDAYAWAAEQRGITLV